jgi:RNA polymerase sigma-70 factor, ECF subfamily
VKRAVGLRNHTARRVSLSRAAEGKPNRRGLRIPYVSRSQRGRPGPPRAIPGDLDSLLGAVARGEHGAFDLVYEQLREPVYRQVWAVLRDPAQSEEVTQEVFLELWSTAVHYDPDKGSAAGWAMMIARRRAIDRVRSSVASTARDQHAARPAELWDQTHEAAADALDRERLARSLNQLTGPQREAITLAYFGDHTYSQVAAILGAPLGTVKGRIREALIKLRHAMLSDD